MTEAVSRVWVLLAVWALVGLHLTWPAGIWAQPAETAQVGGVALPLVTPAGMIRVDGQNAEADQALERLKLPGIVHLAFYAEQGAWTAFKDGLTQTGPPSLLDYYAFVTTAETLADQDLSLTDFDFFKTTTLGQLREMAEASDMVEIMGDGPRWLTYRMAMQKTEAGGRVTRAEQITSYVLVQGKILTLTTTGNDRNKFQDRFRSGALDWRDAYLQETSK